MGVNLKRNNKRKSNKSNYLLIIPLPYYIPYLYCNWGDQSKMLSPTGEPLDCDMRFIVDCRLGKSKDMF